MNDQTEIITKPETDATAPDVRPSESHMLNMSVRAWIALIVIVTVCYMAIALIEVKEPLYSISLLTVGFFFGQASKPKTQSP